MDLGTANEVPQRHMSKTGKSADGCCRFKAWKKSPQGLTDPGGKTANSAFGCYTVVQKLLQNGWGARRERLRP
jgi:hypothetical protein